MSASAAYRAMVRHRIQDGSPGNSLGPGFTRDCPENGSVALSVVAGCADVSRSVMIDAIELAGTVFSGLTALVIEDVEDAGEVIRVQVKSAGGEVACPGCGAGTERVHGYHERTAADVPAGGRRVVVTARLRRLRCPVLGCRVQTFREQVTGTLERYQRRTARMTAQLAAVARELAGRASARLLPGCCPRWESGHPGTRPCGRCSGSRFPFSRSPGSWGSTTSRCAAAWSTRLSSSMRRRAGVLMSSPAGPQTPLRSGCALTPGSGSSAGTGRVPMARQSGCCLPAR